MQKLTNGLKTEWEKLRGMSFAEKRQYVWEYYKIHIFGVLISVFVVGSLINVWFINPPVRAYVYFAWVGPIVSQASIDEFTELLSGIVDQEGYEVRSTNYALSDGDPQFIMAMQTRFMANIQLGEIDVFLASIDDLREFADAGFLAPLYGLLDAAAHNTAFSDMLGQRLVSLPGSESHVAISLEGLGFFEDIGVSTQDLHLALTATGTRHNRVAKALEAIFDAS